ncbi:hypothetical protein ACOMHN_066177 [Nucella lapillus]
MESRPDQSPASLKPTAGGKKGGKLKDRVQDGGPSASLDVSDDSGAAATNSNNNNNNNNNSSSSSINAGPPSKPPKKNSPNTDPSSTTTAPDHPHPHPHPAPRHHSPPSKDSPGPNTHPHPHPHPHPTLTHPGGAPPHTTRDHHPHPTKPTPHPHPRGSQTSRAEASGGSGNGNGNGGSNGGSIGVNAVIGSNSSHRPVTGALTMSAEEWRLKEDVPVWRLHEAGFPSTGSRPPAANTSGGDTGPGPGVEGGGGVVSSTREGLSARDNESYYDEDDSQSAGRKFTKKGAHRNNFG